MNTRKIYAGILAQQNTNNHFQLRITIVSFSCLLSIEAGKFNFNEFHPTTFRLTGKQIDRECGVPEQSEWRSSCKIDTTVPSQENKIEFVQMIWNSIKQTTHTHTRFHHVVVPTHRIQRKLNPFACGERSMHEERRVVAAAATTTMMKKKDKKANECLYLI